MNDSLKLEAANALVAHEARLADEEEVHRKRYRDLELKLTAALSSLAGLTSTVEQLQQRATEAQIESRSSPGDGRCENGDFLFLVYK